MSKRGRDPEVVAREELIKKIRKLPDYRIWKEDVLLEHGYDPQKPPKGIQVHHREEISSILKRNDVKSIQRCYRCKELWKVENGVPLKRGEHFILTRLTRYKYITPGFREFILRWISNCKVGKAE